MQRQVRMGLVATLLLGGVIGKAGAQETSSGWKWIVQPYFMLSHMNGTLGVGPVDAEVDVGPDEIFSHLQFGFMLNVEARSPVWAVALDAIYMDLEENAPGDNVRVGAEQSALELAVFRRLGKSVEVLAGGRYNHLNSTIDGPLQDRSGSQSWFDPIVGFRVSTPDENKWSFSIRGDVGGFGVGSKLAIQLSPILGFRLSRTIGLALGYRYIDQDYENDDASFRYDVATFGPELRVRIYF